jgi:RNA polymerase sigma-70 factor (ECF subfamily)
MSEFWNSAPFANAITVNGHMADSRQAGRDPEAFTALYRAHSPAVFRFALHMTGDRMKAAEITQDVFVWLIYHPGDFDPARGEMGPFLIGVARKILLRRQSTERRWAPFDERAAAEWVTELPEDETLLESQAAELRQAIAALPARYREVVVLCDLEGRSYDQAAAALECAVGTVRSRLHRARELLGRKLQSKKQFEACALKCDR